MHPVLLTFATDSLEKEFSEQKRRETSSSVLLVTCFILLISAVCMINNGISSFECEHEVVLFSLLCITIAVGSDWIEYYCRRVEIYILYGFYIIWLVLLEVLLQETVSTARQNLLHSILIRMGAWITLTGPTSPLISKHYIPFQWLTVCIRFAVLSVDYDNDILFSENLRAFWEATCSWNGLWLQGIDVDCPDRTHRDNLQRIHFFLSILIGFVLPSLLHWIWEVQRRIAFIRRYREWHSGIEVEPEYIPFFHIIALTLTTTCLFWHILSLFD